MKITQHEGSRSKKNAASQDPAVGACLWSYGVPRGGGSVHGPTVFLGGEAMLMGLRWSEGRGFVYGLTVVVKGGHDNPLACHHVHILIVLLKAPRRLLLGRSYKTIQRAPQRSLERRRVTEAKHRSRDVRRTDGRAREVKHSKTFASLNSRLEIKNQEEETIGEVRFASNEEEET